MTGSHRRVVLYLLLTELVSLPVIFLISHGRTVDMLAWISAVQFLLLGFWGLVIWIVKHNPSNSPSHLGRNNKTRQQVIVGLATLAFIFLLVLWTEVVVPMIVRLSIQKYGQTTTAQIVSYKLIHYGPRTAEYTEYDVARADAIVATLSYVNHITTIKAEKGEQAFDLLYQTTQTPGILQVKYLSILPSLVLPTARSVYNNPNPSFNFGPLNQPQGIPIPSR